MRENETRSKFIATEGSILFPFPPLCVPHSSQGSVANRSSVLESFRSFSLPLLHYSSSNIDVEFPIVIEPE